MRILSFLVFALFLCIPCAGFTVVLKSGKHVDGKLLAEDQTTLQLKDTSGTVLSFKKANLDLAAMDAANSRSVNSAPETQSTRKKSVRVYTNEDLDRMPDLGVVSGDAPVLETQELEAAKEAETDGPGSRPERYWRSRAISLKKELARLREKQIQVEANCSQARQNSTARLVTPHKNPINMLSLFDDPQACKLLEEITSQLEEAQERWDTFETEARRAEVPWNWLE